MTVRVALLRGINVGGHHKVPMAELRALFTELGCTAVKTLIQSGNVVYRHPDDPSAAELAAAIQGRFGFAVPVMLRTPEELSAAIARYPFGGPGVLPKHTRIGFLDAVPSPDAVAALDPDRSPGDRFAVLGAEIHMLLPNGGAKSKLTADWFERKLKVVGTFRNLRTIQKIVDAAAAL